MFASVMRELCSVYDADLLVSNVYGNMVLSLYIFMVIILDVFIFCGWIMMMIYTPNL